jgi:lipopolysaccharide export system protein LptA
MPSSSLCRVLAASLSVFMWAPAWAERADRNRPLTAEADAMRHDDLKQTTVFSGNVVITKGTITLRGGRVEVVQTPDGYQRAQVVAAPGTLAYYRSKRDGVDEHMEGEAELIEYDGRSDAVQFSRRAVLRRYVGSTVADETSGSVIRYDNTAEVFTVDGARAGTGSSSRVRAVLSPRSAPPSPAAPAAAPAPSPALRPSPGLTDKK